MNENTEIDNDSLEYDFVAPEPQPREFVEVHEPDNDRYWTSLEEELKDLEDRWNELKPGFIKAVERLKDGIENGRWCGVISDDRMARFPSMVIRRVISKYNNNHGLVSGVPLRYIQGPRAIERQHRADFKDEADAMYKKYIEDIHQQDPDGRQLLVTQIIDQGIGIASLAKRFKDADIKYDIYSFSTTSDADITGSLKTLDNDTVLMTGDTAEEVTITNFLDEIENYTDAYPRVQDAIGENPHYDRSYVEHKNSEIPVSKNMQQKSLAYAKWRKLCRRMGNEVYAEVFGAAQHKDEAASMVA